MTSSETPTDLRAAAVRLARMGGEIAAKRIGQAETHRKEDRSYITQVDFEIQDALLAVLAEEFPSHAVLAEEEQSQPDRHASTHGARFCWVIDPLDGTRNFSRALPVFATSVAVLDDGRPVAGAVCHAMTGQVFEASAGGGTTVDGRGIRVRDKPPSPDTIITMRGRSGHPAPPEMHHWIDRHALRNLGSAALHLALVAGGVTDAAYQQQCKLWDLAAGYLLVVEAGGVISLPSGAPIFPRSPAAYRDQDIGFLAAGPALHEHLLRDIRTVGK